MQEITLDSTIQRIENRVIETEIDDDVVMMDIENGNYLRLNRTGKFIWQNVKEPIVLQELICLLVESFDIEQEKCVNETIKFFSDLRMQNLLIVSE